MPKVILPAFLKSVRERWWQPGKTGNFMRGPVGGLFGNEGGNASHGRIKGALPARRVRFPALAPSSPGVSGCTVLQRSRYWLPDLGFAGYAPQGMIRQNRMTGTACTTRTDSDADTSDSQRGPTPSPIVMKRPRPYGGKRSLSVVFHRRN